MAATVAVLGRDALCPSWPTRGRRGKARHEERPTSAGERQQVEFCLHLSDALELHVERRAQRGHLQRLRVKAHGELLECHQRGLGHDAPRVSAGEGAPPEWLGGQLQSLTGERSAGLFRFAQRNCLHKPTSVAPRLIWPPTPHFASVPLRPLALRISSLPRTSNSYPTFRGANVLQGEPPRVLSSVPRHADAMIECGSNLTRQEGSGLWRDRGSKSVGLLSQEAHSICNLRTRRGREQRRQALQPGRDGAEIGSEHLRRRLSHTVRAYGDATDCFVSASLASGLTHCLH